MAEPSRDRAPSLAGVHSRLAWAQHHIGHLRSLVDAYANLPPFEISDEPSPDGHWRVQRARLTVEPPSEISLALGDVAHQLRAALDNAVCALRTRGPNRYCQFPITQNEKAFESAARRQLQGLSPELIDVVRSVQTFDEHLGFWFGPRLAILDEVAQHDRHRAILLRGAVLSTSVVEVAVPDPPHDAVDFIGLAEVRLRADVPATTRFQAQVIVSDADPRLDNREVIGLANIMAFPVLDVVARMERAVLDEVSRTT